MQYLRGLARHRLALAAIAFLAGVIVLTWSWLGRPATVEPPADQSAFVLAPEQDEPIAASETTLPAAEAVVAYVSGAVRSPDVYQLPADGRIKDLVLAAGGLTQDADSERINLAERLKDGEHVHIPRQGEPAPSGGEPTSAAESAGLVDINSAGEAELGELPGIGQALAARIVEHRDANGPFKSVEDLRNVKGIGAALLAKIASLVTVGP